VTVYCGDYDVIAPTLLTFFLVILFVPQNLQTYSIFIVSKAVYYVSSV